MELVAFLVDITSQLNELNRRLQGQGNTVCDLKAAVRSFEWRLEIFKSRWTGRSLACAAGMLALTSAGYCAYRWLKRTNDLQAAEHQAAHGSVVDDVEEVDTTEVTDPSAQLLCDEQDPQTSADALVTEVNIQLRSTSLDPQKSAVILNPANTETPAPQCPLLESIITPWVVFESLYTPGELLGEGGFGTVCAGVRNADGKQVALKYVGKTPCDRFITIPGETQSLPVEVALMKMVSKPLCCKNVLEMLQWFEMSDCFILVLERPSPCMDVQQFLEHHDGWLSEALAQKIMSQVVKAAHHCCNAGVLHRDIKAENLLINPDTLEVKLIDFGCGDLLSDTPFTEYEGTWCFSPPEWVCDGEYLGCPATMWGLGVLLFLLVCGHLPFHNEDEIVYRKMDFAPGLSEACHSLINWCLDPEPECRPTFEEILSHQWFTSGGSE
ncbi:serine/threonine-protein kinase pim-1-like [Hemibagrus wyckioides]|uniref:serine/threonine-protein kinase pim-1-like n=2 Tax=Hemibagrus wyckioides TaxID=337641 RepID=UPI00266B92DF|nr:serine/threonine-protein kinase pim-1-like [Hemibagrus wyckioides]